MSKAQRIKTAFERYTAILEKRPTTGQDTIHTKATVSDGLTCQVTGGNWSFTADMPEGVGGDHSAPSPGVYSRFALASCLSIGYMMWAAKLEVPLSGVEVNLETDADDRPLFMENFDGPHYTEFRYHVSVQSSAPEEDILRVLDASDAHSPISDLFRRPQTLIRSSVQITQPQD